MGIFDKLKKEKPKVEEQVSTNACSLCGQPGADKKFAGQYWHKKCLRQSRKMAKKMI